MEGSKPLSEEERDSAYRSNHQYRPGVIHGYPLLQRSGEWLRQQEVSFTDLTAVFEGVTETLYIDDCCHFNQRGNELLAEAVAQAIFES